MAAPNPPGIWTEHRNAEGRTYWYNTSNKESVWEKPEDLKSPFERALAQTPWKEYFSGGRKYYYHSETKESKWDMPDELLLLLEKVEKEQKSNQPPPGSSRLIAPNFTAGAQLPPNPTLGLNGTDGAVGRPLGSITPGGLAGGPAQNLPMAASGVLPPRPNMPDDPVIPHNGFATHEEAEKAFNHLLRKAGVDSTWTWDQTMRAVITDPLYKSLNTLAEKKATWQKYVDTLKAKETEEREARLSKLRPALRNMLKGNPNVFHYTTFATADRLFAQHPIWQQARIESERKLIFEEYVAELKQREVQESREIRARSISKVVTLFKQLEVDVMTRWRQAQGMLLDSSEWRSDNELQKLPALDVLLAFEDYSRVKEREFEEMMRKNQIEKARKERKAREAFKSMLAKLVDEKKIRARTKWKEVYPLFSSSAAYLDMLGTPGSNPLELFWDVVDELDQALDERVAIVENALKKRQSVLSVETKAEELLKVLKEAESGDDEVHRLSGDERKEVWEALHDQAVKIQAEEKRRAERHLRHMQDDLRYALKKLDKPIDLNSTYEDAVPLMQDLAEYVALEDEEARRAAFAKFIKRQKEKLKETSEDGGSTTSRKRKEPPEYEGSDRASYRERDERGAYKDRDRERDRDREKDKDRAHDRDDRGRREYEKERHGGRHGREEHERERRDYRERDRDRDYYPRGSGRHRDSGRDRERKKDSGRTREKDTTKRSRDEMDWEDGYGHRSGSKEHESQRARSAGPGSSVQDEREHEREKEGRSKREADPDVEGERRVEKKPRLSGPEKSGNREDTPEEGEI